MRVLNSRSPQDCATSGMSIKALLAPVCDGGHDVKRQCESKHQKEAATQGVQALNFKLHHYLLLALIAIEQIYWAE